jgi:UDP-N-acetylglucosamine 1-carboxyvinyltransferase
MLVKMGARIIGIGSNVLTITGAAELGGCTHDVGPDHIEIGSFMALAGVTGGELRIKDTDPGDLRMIRLVFGKLGLQSHFDGHDIVVPGDQRLVVGRDLGDHMVRVQDGPWPQFPADLTSIAVALATQSEGQVLIHEWMFESACSSPTSSSRWARTSTSATRTVPSSWAARSCVASASSRPTSAPAWPMLIAALCADGRTEIGNIRQIDRGYERIDERLRALGARIERVAAD